MYFSGLVHACAVVRGRLCRIDVGERKSMDLRRRASGGRGALLGPTLQDGKKAGARTWAARDMQTTSDGTDWSIAVLSASLHLHEGTYALTCHLFTFSPVHAIMWLLTLTPILWVRYSCTRLLASIIPRSSHVSECRPFSERRLLWDLYSRLFPGENSTNDQKLTNAAGHLEFNTLTGVGVGPASPLTMILPL